MMILGDPRLQGDLAVPPGAKLVATDGVTNGWAEACERPAEQRGMQDHVLEPLCMSTTNCRGPSTGQDGTVSVTDSSGFYAGWTIIDPDSYLHSLSSGYNIGEKPPPRPPRDPGKPGPVKGVLD